MNFLYVKPSLKGSASLCFSLGILFTISSSAQSLADEVSVKETSITTAAPVNTASTVTVEHTKSVMEPSVVQETVGASGRTVQPLIMERKDKLLDRTTYTTKPTGAVTTTTTVVKDSPVDPPQVIEKTVAP